MIDRLTSMEVFVKAVDLGSFTAAATAMGLSSQMVGKHVRSLEQRLGTQLMRRSTRRQSLTETGRLYYDRCRSILLEVKAAEAVAEDLNAAPRGRLRLSAPVGFGACRLAPMLTSFVERYPEVAIELVLTDRYVDLVDEGYDAVLRLGPVADTSLAARELAPHELVACASPGYLARRGAPRTPADLCDHACLGFVNASGLPYLEWRFTDEDGTPQSIRVRSRFQVNDGRVLADAAIAGAGIMLQPEAVLREHLDAGRLMRVLANYSAPSRPMLLMFSGQRSQPPKLRALIDAVVSAFAAPA